MYSLSMNWCESVGERGDFMAHEMLNLKQAAEHVHLEMNALKHVAQRGEIAATAKGMAQNDVGINTDVLDGYRKADGITQAVRTLSPQLIVCDEIGTKADCEAVRHGVNSGVAFAAAVHAADADELLNKTYVMRLIKCGAFAKIAFLRSGRPCCLDKIIDARELLC